MEHNTESKALNLTAAQQQNFVRFFINLPEKPATTVRFFNRNDYYTVHGEDAVLAASIFSMNINYMGDQPKLSYICLSKGRFEMLLRELILVKQYRVEVYTKSSQAQNDWLMEYKGSPGNLSQFEEILFDNVNIDFTNAVMGIKLCSSKGLAICSVNTTEAKLEVCEINDNESFSELEAIITHIGPKECIIPVGETPELVTLKKIITRNGILVGTVKKSDFTVEDIHKDLTRLLYFAEDQQRNSAAYTETNLKEAMSCLQAVIRFLNLMADSSNFNQYKLTTLDTKRFVRLDHSALYALNIFPKVHSQITDGFSNQNLNKTSSLKGLLDNCVTPQGHRLLNQWIKQPLRDYNLINDRLEVVETFFKNAELRNLLVKDKLPRLVDLVPISKKIASKKAHLQDCYNVYLTNCILPSIVNILNNTENKCVNEMIIIPLKGIIADVENFQTMIEQTLDFDLVKRGEYWIKSSYDEDLKSLRGQKDKIEEKMQRLLSKVADDLELEEGKGVKLECSDMHGFHFRVTLKSETTLRKQKQYKILDTTKNGVKFTTVKLSELNVDYSNTNKEYKERQKAIENEIFEVALSYAETLRTLNNIIASIDVLVSFATAAVVAKIPYIRPNIQNSDEPILKLKKARHPCLEAQDNISYIPNDVSFDSSDKILYVITGPNMGGKSTYIRSIGTCVLMAHIGSFVPCAEAYISLVDVILVRVGADDCQLKGLSTFMLEMVETAAIVKTATNNSLVIIDELGRGTSTYDGCGIASSLVEHLVNEVKCFTLFATHYHEITRLSDDYKNISNVHVTAIASNDAFVPLYHIETGASEKSYGIHCAKMVGFPEDTIEDARKYQEELEHSNGMKYISSMEPSIKRKLISEGNNIIKEATDKIKKIDTDNITDDDLIKIVSDLKNELLSTENLFVHGLLTV